MGNFLNRNRIRTDQEKSAQDPQNAPHHETAFVGMNGEVTGLGFATRDQGAKVEEDQGLLEFSILTNDGKRAGKQNLAKENEKQEES